MIFEDAHRSIVVYPTAAETKAKEGIQTEISMVSPYLRIYGFSRQK